MYTTTSPFTSEIGKQVDLTFNCGEVYCKLLMKAGVTEDNVMSFLIAGAIGVLDNIYVDPVLHYTDNIPVAKASCYVGLARTGIATMVKPVIDKLGVDLSDDEDMIVEHGWNGYLLRVTVTYACIED